MEIRHDSSLQNYLQTLQASSRFRSKVVYTLECINHCLDPSNPNIIGNREYISHNGLKFLALAKKNPEIRLIQSITSVLSRIFNKEIVELALDLLRFINEQELEGQVTEDFVQEICRLAEKVASIPENLAQSMQIVLSMMSKYQMYTRQTNFIVDLICHWTQDHLVPMPLEECLKLAHASQHTTQVMKVLEAKVQRSDLSSAENAAVVETLKSICLRNWLNEKIRYFASVILLMLKVENPDSCIFYQFTPKKSFYFQSSQKLIAIPLTITSQSLEIQFQNIADFLHKEIIDEKFIVEGNIPKESMNKLHFIENSVQRTNQEYDQSSIAKFLALDQLQDPDNIEVKLRQKPSISNALAALSILDNFQFKAENSVIILRNILRIMLYKENTNYPFKILSQIVYTHKWSENNNIFLPYSQVSGSRGIEYEIFQSGFIENWSIGEKFLLFYRIIVSQNHDLTKEIFLYLFRVIDREPLFYHYLSIMFSKHLDSESKQWLAFHFREELDKIIQSLFMCLKTKNPSPIFKTIFQFHKLNLFDEWQSIYKRSLEALRVLDSKNPLLTLDYLQIFEILVEDSKKRPKIMGKKFMEIIVSNWPVFTHEHMFAIERIISFLNQDSEGQQIDQNQPHNSLKEWSLDLIQRKYGKGKQNENFLYYKGLKLMVDEEEDEREYEKALERTLSKNEEEMIIHCQYALLWRFQYSDAILPKNISSICMKYLKEQSESGNLQQTKNWFQMITTLAHEQNLLVLPLQRIISWMGNDSKIIKLATEIIEGILESNPRSLSRFQLQHSILVMIGKLTIANGELGEEIVNFLARVCLETDSPYQNVIPQNINFFFEIIRSQFTNPEEQFRNTVIDFALEMIEIFGLKEIPQYKSFSKYLMFVLYKYINDETITQRVLNLEKNVQMTISNVFIRRIKKIYQENEKIFFHWQADKYGQEQKLEKLIVQQKKHNQIPQHLPDPSILLTQKRSEPNIKKEKISTEQRTVEKSLKVEKKPETLKLKQLVLDEENIFTEPTQTEQVDSMPIPRGQIEVCLPTTNQNIATIKVHIEYIQSLKNPVNKIQEQNLQKTFNYLTETVKSHFYYCKKVINLGLIQKLLQLNKINKEKFMLESLILIKQICLKKEKNLNVFNEEKSVEILKRALKKSINSVTDTAENQEVLAIIKQCRNSMKYFYKFGLLSMLVELAKQDINLVDLLSFFAIDDLHINLINEIYQRGLLAKMLDSIQKMKCQTQKDRDLLYLWIKLAGKICVNPKIREKMFSAGVHLGVKKHLNLLRENGKAQVAATFYGSWCYSYEKACQWCLSEKIPEFFIQDVQKQPKDQIFRFYHYFCLNNPQSVDHLLRIKLPSFLVKIVKESQGENLSKHFYKILSLMITKNNYKVMLKDQIVIYLLKHYNLNNQEAIYECLYKFVILFESIEEFKFFEKQGFWQSLELFDYKLKDDRVYPHLLKIYLHIMNTYGATSSLKSCNVVSKIIRKGIYSLNLEGKFLIIQFIIVLSNIEKVFYGKPRCLEILQSLMRYELEDRQIDLCRRYLAVSQYPTAFEKIKASKPKPEDSLNKGSPQKLIEGIIQILMEKVKQPNLSENMRNKILQIFVNMCDKVEIASKINDNLKETIFHSLQKCKNEGAAQTSQTLDLLINLLKFKEVIKSYHHHEKRLQNIVSQLISFCEDTPEIASKLIEIIGILNKNGIKMNDQFIEMLEKSKHQNIRENVKLRKIKSELKIQNKYLSINEESKVAMCKGIKAKLFKTDGSISELIVFFTEDFMEINCVLEKGQPVKGKWRLPLQQIQTIKRYSSSNNKEFKKSIFGESEGLFRRAPEPETCLSLIGVKNSLNICFESYEKRSQWEQYIEWGNYNCKKILDSLQS